jgi:hypothetical protein
MSVHNIIYLRKGNNYCYFLASRSAILFNLVVCLRTHGPASMRPTQRSLALPCKVCFHTVSEAEFLRKGK